jgi:hypothetical protein
MSMTLEKRVEELERKFSRLAEQTAASSKKSWQKTLGFSRGDEGFDDLVRRGEEYRRGLSNGNGRADS